MKDKLEQYWYTLTHPGSWWTNTRFWWYTSHPERVIVLGILAIVSVTVGLLAHYKVNHAEELHQLRCLALNIYHEARGEPIEGLYAVGEVTLNRVYDETFPDTICEVVHQRHYDPKRKTWSRAFSWTDNEYTVNLNSRSWKKAMQVARDIYDNGHREKLEGALFYHARYVKPRWARRYTVVARIGSHIFYK